MVKTRRPALMSGHEFYVRRNAVGLDLRTFADALDFTISVASKLQTGRSPVNRDIFRYLQGVEDAVENRVAEEFERIESMKVGDLKNMVLLSSQPEDWPHGPGTWQVIVARLRHLIHGATGVSPPIEESPETAAASPDG